MIAVYTRDHDRPTEIDFTFIGKLPLANLFNTDDVPTTELPEIIPDDPRTWKRSDYHTRHSKSSYILSCQVWLEDTSTVWSDVHPVTVLRPGDDNLVGVE